MKDKKDTHTHTNAGNKGGWWLFARVCRLCGSGGGVGRSVEEAEECGGERAPQRSGALQSQACMHTCKLQEL